MKHSIHLLVIDPQNDFVDLPEDWLPPDTAPMDLRQEDSKITPALAVPGAHQDMLRLAGAIEVGSGGISSIYVTLDSHHFVGIERPTFWMTAGGGPVGPFTEITLEQVVQGQYLPRNLDSLPRVKDYLRRLEAAGRYKLMVWPVHCQIGTWGHGVHDAVRRACNQWEATQQQFVNFVTKGANPFTEHYSPFQAEVVLAEDASTARNIPFIHTFAQADRIFVAGQASSHCVKAGVTDLAAHLGGDLGRIVLVRDCMSAVAGFEAQQAKFFADMAARGLQVCTAADMAAELKANA